MKSSKLRKCPKCKAQTLAVSSSVSLMPHGYQREEVRRCPCGYFRRKTFDC